MKTATYTWKGKLAKIYATVTLKDNGKISVSMPGANKYNTSPAERYQAKMLGHAIVAADFKHEAVTNLTEVNTQGLVSRLKEETTELLAIYIERTKKYAMANYKWALEHEHFNDQDYKNTYGVKTVWHINYSMSKGIENYGKSFPSETLSDLGVQKMQEVNRILARTLDAYIKEEVKDAIAHYKHSIERLALKLNRKGIKDDTVMTMESTKIDQNLSTLIHHEGTTTKAWTIFAAMDSVLVKPHFRYLVK